MTFNTYMFSKYVPLLQLWPCDPILSISMHMFKYKYYNFNVLILIISLCNLAVWYANVLRDYAQIKCERHDWLYLCRDSLITYIHYTTHFSPHHHIIFQLQRIYIHMLTYIEWVKYISVILSISILFLHTLIQTSQTQYMPMSEANVFAI